MSWRSALFKPGRMDAKTRLFLSESRTAHDRLTNLLILTYPLLVGVWQFRETAKHFASLTDPVRVRDAVLSYVQFPQSETAVRRLDFTESVIKISWERQRDATAEMMFLVCCSIYENFTSHIQDKLPIAPGASPLFRPVEKGFQFPATNYDVSVSPPARGPSIYSDNVTRALSYFPMSEFMKTHLSPTFPLHNGRHILDDLDLKLHTYLLFKKLRNSISHGRFDSDIPRQYKAVSAVVTAESQGVGQKVTISTDGTTNYFVTLYDVVGFIALLLNIIRDLDFMYLLSEHGEEDLVRRLAATKDAKQLSPSDRKKDLARLRLCLQALGVNDFCVDDNSRTFFITQGAWRP
jgi:hypothetical protein